MYIVRKWTLRGEKSFCVLENHMSKSGYCATCILCRVFVPPLPRDLADLKAWIAAAVKNIDAPMLTRVWQELEYCIDVCCVWGRGEVGTVFWWGHLREREQLKEPRVDGRITLRWISREWDVGAWTGSS